MLRTERRHDPATGAAYAWLVSPTAMVNHFYIYAVDAQPAPWSKRHGSRAGAAVGRSHLIAFDSRDRGAREPGTLHESVASHSRWRPT